MVVQRFEISRRRFLQGCACAAVSAYAPVQANLSPLRSERIVASPATTNLVMDPGYDTSVWAFNGQVPGPLLRYRQGETLRLEVENQLSEPTTVHWHGLRVPNSMDGVPHLSQKPIQPGAAHLYEFELKDAGTFWYHPHFNSSEQVGMGLHGVLIVDEADPPKVHRDVLWVLDDWRLTDDAQIAPFSKNLHDASHNGRLGNVVTVNGTVDDVFAVRSGERLRLRLANVANARTFALNFEDLAPWVVALDGQPVTPHQLQNDPVVLGSGQRADLVIDMTGEPGSEFRVVDNAFGSDFAYRLMRIVYDKDNALQSRLPKEPDALAPNPIPEPDINNAIKHRVVFEGGAMGGLDGAYLNGEFKSLRDLAQLGKLWATNGKVPDNVHFDPPLLSLDLGKTHVFELSNQTAFEHPVHLHGHTFRVISRNNEPLQKPPFRDTVLIQPDETQAIAFVADNPGKWMMHCHVLEHQHSGMTAMVSVV